MVESLLQKLCGFLNTTINNCVQVLKERQTNSCFANLLLLFNIHNFFKINITFFKTRRSRPFPVRDGTGR
jgi:hypothetical protein